MALSDHLRSGPSIKHVIAAFAGILFSLIVWQIMTLEFRFALAAAGALIVVSLCMTAISYLEVFLVYALIFNIPFAAFEKWIFAHPIAVTAKGLTIGLSEILITVAYLLWFMQIFVERTRPLPRLQKIDICLLLLLLVQSLSLIGAPNKTLAAFDIAYNIKYMLIYFFISHKLRKEHLMWVMILFAFAIITESSLGFYERVTGNIGIGLSKGNLASEDFGRQYEVPGTEELRAAGTTNDSHTLGLYYTMLLPFPAVFAMMRFLKIHQRVLFGMVFLIGVGGMLVTFSRSGWLSFAIAITFTILVMAFLWKQKSAIWFSVAALLLVIFLFPKGVTYLYTRLVDAPPEILKARYDTYWTALDIWQRNPFLGYGPGNYIEALFDPEILGQSAKGDWDVDIPVHNALLWVAADLGLFGVLTFFGAIGLAIFYCSKFLRSEDMLIRGISLALMTAFFGYLLDGLTDPMFREAVPYSQLWVCIGMATALARFVKNEQLDSALLTKKLSLG